MKQYCRYCTSLVVGDVNYCATKKKTLSEGYCKVVNTCEDFDLNPIDAFGENPKLYAPRVKKIEQEDNQIKLDLS